MPYIYRTKNKRTGLPHPLWRYEYYDYAGVKRKGTGTPERNETKRIALQVQAKQYAIRNGVAPVPKESDEIRALDDIIGEYMRWGESQGGRRGRPWAEEHADKRRRHLQWWKAQLQAKTQIDLMRCQPKVERVIHRMSVIQGRAGKTVLNLVEALSAFCKWCCDRGYLDADPLKRLTRIDTSPRQRRRAMTPDEIDRLLQHSTPSRALLYKVALCTGLRANELRHITPAHLNGFRCAIRLDAEWTKNRREGFQPVPAWLMTELLAAAKDKVFNARLLDIPEAHSERFFDKDRIKAGIEKLIPGEGKLDFHALRTTYCTLLDMNGASAKECQELARHSTPGLTMSTYVRATETRMRSVVESIGQVVTSPTSQQHPNGISDQNQPQHKTA